MHAICARIRTRVLITCDNIRGHIEVAGNLPDSNVMVVGGDTLPICWKLGQQVIMEHYVIPAINFVSQQRDDADGLPLMSQHKSSGYGAASNWQHSLGLSNPPLSAKAQR